MEREDDINKELEQIAPGFPNKHSMEAPSGYFQTFPDLVLNRWRKEGSQPVLRKRIRMKVVGMAAILTGLCIGGWWFITSSRDHVNEVTAVEAYQYINENIDEFEFLIETDDLLSEDNNIDVPQEAIEEYLMEEMHGANPEDLF